jgi:hypothetical protein
MPTKWQTAQRFWETCLLEANMARKSSTFSVSKIIATRRENLANARRELAALQESAANLRAATHVVNLVADYAEEIGFTQWKGISVYQYSDTLELSVNLEGTVNSLKQGAIVDILERALACQFTATGSSDYLSDWASQRNFKFEQTIAGVKIDLRVTANIADAAACRKVRVGTELKEVNKYEIVCE